MEKRQNYSNHSSIHPAYHLFLLPLATLFLGFSISLFISKGYHNGMWQEAFYYLLGGIIILTAVLLLRVFSLKNQARIIRLEMRLRYFNLTGKPFNEMEYKLSLKQILALRFASDAELLSLTERTLHENLPPELIKKKIRKWKGDYYQL